MKFNSDIKNLTMKKIILKNYPLIQDKKKTI